MGRHDAIRMLVCCLAASCALGTAPRVAADEKASAEAARLAKEGYEACTAGAPADGIPKLEQAYALNPKPDIVFAIAVAYDQWDGHCAEAVSTVRRYFAVCRDCKTLAVAKKRFTRTQERCRARLVVEATPPGATVQVDGKRVGTAPVTVRVTPGRHTVTVTADDHDAYSEAVVLEAAKERKLGVALARRAPPAAGPLAAGEVPGARAEAPRTDEAPRRESAVAQPPVEAPGAEPVAERSPAPGKVEVPSPAPEDVEDGAADDEGGTGSVAGLALVGVGLVGLAGGTVFFVLRGDELEAESDPGISIDEVREHRDRAQRYELAALGGWGAGALGLGAGLLVLWLGGETAAEGAGWSVAPFPGGIGMLRAF